MLAGDPRGAVDGLFFLNPSVGWMPRKDGGLLKTVDGGLRWTPRPGPAPKGKPAAPHLVRFADERQGWVAAGRELFRTVDGGDTWQSTLELAERLSVFALATRDHRRLVAGVEGECSAFEQAGGNYASEDAGVTWHDVLDPREAETDWEALSRDREPTSAGQRLLVAETRGDGKPGESWSANLVEAWTGDVDPARAMLRSMRVERRGFCGDVELLAREQDLGASLSEWSGGFDPCTLDPARASAVLEQFSDPSNSDPRRLVAQCGPALKVFQLPGSIQRRRLARISPSLHSLMRTVDAMFGWRWWDASILEPSRKYGATVVPLLLSGGYDAALSDPALLRAVLMGYEGPFPPKGELARVERVLPDGVTLRHEVMPAYPAIAVQARASGDVVLDLRVTSTGEVGEVQLISGPKLLDASAIEAARQWRFEAGERTTPVRVTVNFTIDRCARGGQVWPY
jgi:TonB family protein